MRIQNVKNQTIQSKQNPQNRPSFKGDTIIQFSHNFAPYESAEAIAQNVIDHAPAVTETFFYKDERGKVILGIRFPEFLSMEEKEFRRYVHKERNLWNSILDNSKPDILVKTNHRPIGTLLESILKLLKHKI
jgi:hypothetical protein